ncbi:hypothetical protein [Virgisporangium aurantiacum]|uniref:Uncharacterized protein n=1 Tax=Virgisporangium aurantiacum TaxID=175570 RepID=A0A8J4E4J2_9ACTN|nr:hypothetical protein [Virgisporangium aurantiacum]GIJ62005.1 hypothetical protein Vau01_095210 [Virgisporangium aurantiacum]
MRDLLRDLHVKAGGPTADNLKEHSDRSGHSVARSTLAGVVRGHGGLRWVTVEAFVDACVSYAKARRQPLPPEAIDKRGWREGYDKAYASGPRKKSVAPAPPTAPAPRRGTGHPPEPPARAVPRYEIGVGVPGWRGSFQRAWNELTADGLWIGDPATPVHEEGPGVIQVFESHQSLFG